VALEPSGGIIEKIKRQLGLDENTHTVFMVWEKELGPLAGGVRLIGFKDGKLMAEADSNVHLQEITLRRKDIIKKINQHFGNTKVVTGIRLRLK
jgi:hypothetical protein